MDRRFKGESRGKSRRSPALVIRPPSIVARSESSVVRLGLTLANFKLHRIESKMRELGYRDEDLGSYAFRGHSLVNQPRDLTNRSEFPRPRVSSSALC